MKGVGHALAIGTACATLLLSFDAMATAVQWKVADGGNGHFYEAVIVPEGITWMEANAAASQGGPSSHLVTITSAEENAFVFDLVDSPEFWGNSGPDFEEGPYLGGFQPTGSVEPDGGWRWVTDEPFDFTNWRPGEPNDFAPVGGEDFLAFAGQRFSRDSRWNDLPGDSGDPPGSAGIPIAYIVESRSVPEPTTLALIGLGLAGLGFGRVCDARSDEMQR